MEEFIGLPLENVIKYLEKNKLQYEVRENNFNVDGDTTLVTNIKQEKGIYIIIVGKFIFDLKGNVNAKS